jgi:hypothetical protein
MLLHSSSRGRRPWALARAVHEIAQVRHNEDNDGGGGRNEQHGPRMPTDERLGPICCKCAGPEPAPGLSFGAPTPNGHLAIRLGGLGPGPQTGNRCDPAGGVVWGRGPKQQTWDRAAALPPTRPRREREERPRKALADPLGPAFSAQVGGLRRAECASSWVRSTARR